MRRLTFFGAHFLSTIIQTVRHNVRKKKDLLNRDLPGIVKDSDTKVLYLLNLTVVGKTFQA